MPIGTIQVPGFGLPPIGYQPFAPGPQVELKSKTVNLGDLTSIATTPITVQAGIVGSGKLIRPYSITFVQQLLADTFTVNPLLRCGFTGKIGQCFADAQCSNAANRFLVFDAGANSNFNGGANVEIRGLDLIIWGSGDATWTGPAHGSVFAIVSYAILKGTL